MTSKRSATSHQLPQIKMHLQLLNNKKKWIKAAVSSIISSNPKTIALSGGSTPKEIYEALAKKNLQWNKVAFFQVDERYISKENPSSNYKLINDTLIDKTKSKFFFFDTSLPIATALKNYAKTLPKKFDLIILGIGPDGHTASLFPNSKALNSKAKVAHTQTKQFDIKDRLTLTFGPILNSKKIIVLLKGKEKSEIIHKLKDPKTTIKSFPAKKILKHKNLEIAFLDQ